MRQHLWVYGMGLLVGSVLLPEAVLGQALLSVESSVRGEIEAHKALVAAGTFGGRPRIYVDAIGNRPSAAADRCDELPVLGGGPRQTFDGSPFPWRSAEGFVPGPPPTPFGRGEFPFPRDVDQPGGPIPAGLIGLTEAQQDKVFSILHAQAPAVRDQEKLLRKTLGALHDMARSDTFDTQRARGLAAAAAKAMSELAFLRAETDYKLREILTPEQRGQMHPIGDEPGRPDSGARRPPPAR